MFTSLLRFEIKDRLWRLSSLVYFLVYLLLSFMLAVTFAGAFKGASVNFGLSNKLALNSPVVLNYLICFIGYIGLLVTAPLFGQSVNKDFENKFSQILFATPLTKTTYFFVRYIGSFISSLAILSSIAVGIWIATYMPFIDRTLVGENRFWFYLAPFLTNVIPNILIFGAIFIAVVSFFKKMAPVYIASISVFTGWLISQSLTSDLENKFLAAMVEPLGLESATQVIRYWSVAEQSSRVIPITGVFLYNRLLWGTIGLGFLILAYVLFNPFRLPKEKKKKFDENVPTFSFKALNGILPAVTLNPQSYKVFLGLAWSEFKQAFSNVYFLMILLCGVLYIFSISGQVGKIYGTETLPVTYHVLEVIGGSFSLFVVILTTFYAGELVWKDRDLHFYELVDSKPVSGTHLYLSKLLSLFLIQIFLSVVILVCCVLIQAFKGYFNFEWQVYFEHLFIYSLPSRLMVCVLALFIQSLASNKYIGHSFVILYWILLLWLPSLGLDHRLYLIGQIPRSSYSDMNRFGTSSWAFTVIGLYWGLFHFALGVLTILVWRRGAIQNFKGTVLEFKRRIQLPHKMLLSTSMAGWVLVGGFIFYNTNVLNPYETKSEKELKLVDYERVYKSFEKKPQPALTSVRVEVDIFPENQSLKAKGFFKYKNETSVPIKQVLVNLDKNLSVQSFQWSRPTKLATDDQRLEVKIYEFDTPLLPNEEVNLEFADSFEPKGFTNDEFQKKIVQNGSFFYGSDFAPVIGYSSGKELTEDKSRRKYNLADRPRMADVNDKDALNTTYISDEGTWIDFEATVSTSKDQIAIAPGYLEREWNDGERRYFHYKMDRPILNFYAFLSARYEVVRDEWNGVKIEVYYHHGHTVDIPRMINSTKKSLDYFTKNFSPYQFRQFRIIEFPRYATFAQAFPNTIPYSESIGFIAKVREGDPESIDFPFYVTSHEMAHQWWAHQVIGGKVQGATMLSESLAQYSALMVQEKEYGAKQMKKFLKYELDKYLNGRSRETKKELPLALNENQQYIHYNKGSIVFYALKDYLGEDVVNGVLKAFIKDVAFKDAPFPRAVDLVERFKRATPADKKYLIEDLFETITFYDNRTDSVTVKKEGDTFKVFVKGHSKKVRADELVQETEIPMNDFVDVGLFDKDGNILYLQKHRLISGENTIEISLDKRPAKGGIDPINKLIDKVSDDNLIKITEVQ